MTTYTYLNGNYLVSIDTITGTKIRRSLRIGEEFKPDFPDSIDLKITNSCSHGCPFCHESSVPGGKHFDLLRTQALLDQLPEKIELAIGGGNVFDIPQQTLESFLNWTLDRFFPRLTISYHDLDSWNKLPKELREKVGLGVSVYTKGQAMKVHKLYPNAVLHLIVGKFPLKDFEELLEVADCNKHSWTSRITETKILLLGFKSFGRALKKKPYNLDGWKTAVRKTLWNGRWKVGSSFVVGFDNLAIDQLGIRDALTETEWKSTYQGDEFTSTMYIDAVEETFAPTSRDTNRLPWNLTNGIIDYFNVHHNP